jgi:hypothetical protein
MLDTRIEEGLRGMAEEEQKRLEEDPKGMNGEFRFRCRLSLSFPRSCEGEQDLGI